MDAVRRQPEMQLHPAALQDGVVAFLVAAGKAQLGFVEPHGLGDVERGEDRDRAGGIDHGPRE